MEYSFYFETNSRIPFPKIKKQIDFDIGSNDLIFFNKIFFRIEENKFRINLFEIKKDLDKNLDLILSENQLYQFISLINPFKEDKIIKELAYNEVNGWSSLQSFFSSANIRNNYLILRKHEKLDNKNEDIDVLCENKLWFVNDLFLEKRNWGISSYKVKIKNKMRDFDIRFLGDNYFDSLWQINMLSKKSMFNGYFILNTENHYFSYLYHILIHKKELKKEYINYLNNIGLKNKITVINKNYLIKELNNFMSFNGYQYITPFDSSILVNKQIVNKLHYKTIEKIPLKDLIYMKIPAIILKYYKNVKSLFR